MNLYQIFYRGGSFDSNGPLPERPYPDTLYAMQTTDALMYLIPGRSGAWVRTTKEDALARE